MKNCLLLLIIASTFFSCSNNKKNSTPKINDTLLSVSLQWKADNEFDFFEIYYTNFPVYTSKKAYPKIYEQKIKKFKNTTKFDSLLFVSTPMQKFPSVYRKYINDYGGKDYLFKAFNDQLKDTVIIKNKNLKYEFNAISGFLNDKQIVIPDLNNNGDFSDDQRLLFPKEFHNQKEDNSSVLDTLPLLDFSYQLLKNGKIHNIDRKVIIYPSARHRHIYLLKNDLNETLNAYTLFLELKDYAKGTITKDSIHYTIAVQGKEPFLSDIVIKPDSVFYHSHNLLMQSYFSHKKGDTVSLGRKWYKIKGISPDFKKIEFTKVASAPKLIKKGIQLGKKLNNPIITAIDGTEKNLFSEMNDKEYMLLDFWGTWCGPCKKLTPKLIDMYKRHGNNVSFVSIAYDENVNDVKLYTDENNMQWFHGFVDRKDKTNTIIDTWNIKSFPTFLLIDKNQQILYMGAGGLILDEMDEMIKKLKY
ncbi:TlpA family protein disulfide reductase [Aestuariivivens insulae]|uniref:TlpA family protein disulfide reductase n=1 Tax=Aestuariivivens insulae TaxID=1621988 RepID=UPI001F5A72DA|nr:TlpA disulfide reductase family protein [Aestuariivivens insulae]